MADRLTPQANEIFPTHLRAKGTMCCVASYSLINIMWTQVSPVAFENIGWKFYMVFVSCCVVAAVIMYFTYPDTLNKPLEEVAKLFGDDDLVALYSESVPCYAGDEEQCVGSEKGRDDTVEEVKV